MDSLMLGTFLINMVVSVSMKKILGAIKVIQVVAFFIKIQLNYPPLCLMFLEAIYQFTTFKIIPEGAMDDVLDTVGLNDEARRLKEI